MRDELNKTTRQDNECMVINTDSSLNKGTHWTCLFVKNGPIYYFDPFGFPPPLEVINYCDMPPAVSTKHRARYYNTFPIQKMNEVICGHYCIYVLERLTEGDDFYDLCFELYD